MYTYTVALAKGGVGKSTTAAELAYQLATQGRRVLAIDLDQQGNMTTRLGVSHTLDSASGAADLLRGDATAEDAAIPSGIEGVDVIAGTHELADVESLPEVVASLRDYLPTLTRWDAAVIDTPPALGVVTLAGLAAADLIVAPVPPQAEALEQLHRLESFIARRVRRLKPAAEVGAVVPTMYRRLRVLDREMVEQLRAKYGERVTEPIRETVAVRDAYVSGETIGAYAPQSTAAQDYAVALADLIAVGDAQ